MDFLDRPPRLHTFTSVQCYGCNVP